MLRGVLEIRAPAVAGLVPMIAACESWDCRDTREPKDKQGTVARLVRIIHFSTPRLPIKCFNGLIF
jgi:hypothetical protein